MDIGSDSLRTMWRGLGVATLGVVAITAAGAGTASAGHCPADRVIASRDVADRATAPSGITDTVLGSIDLANEAVRAEGYKLRLRRLVVQPGGVVPWNEHHRRPAIIYIVEGQVTEYSNTCAVPIPHHAGEVAQESRGLGHW